MWCEKTNFNKHIYTNNRDYMGLDVRKPVFGALQTTKAQTSLCNAQSDQRLCYLVNGKCHIFTFYRGNCNILGILCS